LQKLSRAKSPTEEWEAKAKVLQENVEHHVEEEEGELFKKAQSALSAEEIETLGEQMENEKARQQRGAGKGSKKSAKKSASKSQTASRAPKRTPARKSASKSSSKSSGSKKSRSKKSAKKR